MTRTLRNIVDDDLIKELCTGCGTCAGICYNSAIEMVIDKKKGIYAPKIDNSQCKKCGLCFQVCPVYSINTTGIEFQSIEKSTDTVLLGNFMNCYIGNSVEENIRYNSSSGGLVTSLLIFALEKGIIDGALVTKMNKENPFISEPFIAKTKEEIIDASQSKYCPVSTNIAIKEILKQNGKIAVVGLPCHIKGFKLAEKMNSDLKKKVVLHLGLFCSHTNNYNCMEFLINKLNISKKNIKEIRYRCRGWPGGILIKLKDYNEKFINNQSSLWNTISNSFFFTPRSCLFCRDLTAELADLSFGDPWLPEIIIEEKVGKSVLISRSKEGELLLLNALSNMEIELCLISSKHIIRSQKTFLHFKKINIYSRIFITKLVGRKTYYNYSFKNNVLNQLIAIIPLVNNYVCSKSIVVNLLKYIPFLILRIYVFGYYLIYTKIIKRDFGDDYEL
jgi:coenzyme F420 hydrogenase subunit beta